MTRADPKQTSLDFSLRGHRLRLLNRLELPKMPGTSPAAMLSVLRRLDDHARDDVHCRVKVNTIVDGSGLSRRSVFRALAAMEELGVISRHYTGRSSFFRIEWSDLAELEKEASATPAVAHQGCHHGTPAVPPWHTSSATMAHQGCHHGTPTEASLEALSPPPPETGADAESWEAAAADVLQAGVNRWRPAIAQAQSAGVSAEYVLACVAIFHQVGAWDPGGLHDRLMDAAPFARPEQASTWPPPKPADAHQQAAAELLRRVRAWCAEKGHTDAAARFQLAARSEEHGPYTETQIARALFEADLYVPARPEQSSIRFQGANER